MPPRAWVSASWALQPWAAQIRRVHWGCCVSQDSPSVPMRPGAIELHLVDHFLLNVASGNLGQVKHANDDVSQLGRETFRLTVLPKRGFHLPIADALERFADLRVN